MIPQFREILDRWFNRGFWVKVVLVVLISFGVFFISAGVIIKVCGEHIIPYYDVLDGDDALWQLYYYFADPGNQMSGKGGARWVGLVFSTLGSIFLSGILISTITNSFERMSDNWRSGFSYYKLKNHIVIIGTDQMVYGLVNQLPCRA